MMKKIRRFTVLALIVILSLLVLSGCRKKEDQVTSVALKDHDPGTAIEFAVGDFDCDQYTVVVSYESGSTEELTLTEEMIAEADLFKLYQIGDHEITICYENQEYTFPISVKRASFGTLTFPENNVFTYDGKAHTVEVDGNIPANAIVTYPGGNSFVNAGTYDVTAIVSCEGYVTARLTTTVQIQRAKYDMSGVRFEGKEVVYDGTAHSVTISGTLPQGVSSPVYTINEKMTSSATDVGEYTVKATFVNDNPNYEAIPEMQATLKITPAEYTVKGVDLVFHHEDGNLINGATKIYDGKGVTFDLNDYNKLSKKVSVAFSVYDKDGTLISTSNKNTGILNAGVYTVKVEFLLKDGKNYLPIDPLVRTFEVLKAEYPSIDESVQFVSSQATYDGKEHSLAIEGLLPDDVTVSYEYYLEGVLVVDGEGKPAQSVVDAGRYTVKAVLSHTDVNRKEIVPLSATLQVEKAKLNTLMMRFEYEKTWVYDGAPKSVTVVGQPEDLEINLTYYQNGSLVTDENGAPATAVTEVGEYTVMVDFNVTNDNYASMEQMSLTFSIVASSN